MTYYGDHSIQIIRTSSNIYKSANSNDYNGYNTWTDWHLVPSTRPVIDPPPTKTNFIDIPGANGVIDATEVLNNYPSYGQRVGEQEFYVANGYQSWHEIYSDIMDYVHGRSVYVILRDDPAYYYKGRVYVNKWKSEKDWSKIVLNFELEPFKYEVCSANDRWRWDPFSFTDGIIRNYDEYNNLTITSTKKVITIEGRTMPVIPRFIVSAAEANTEITITREKNASGSGTASVTKKYTCTDTDAHELRYYDIEFRGGKSYIGLKAQSGKTFTVSVIYRGGRL